MKEGREGKRVEVRERKKEAEPDRLRLEAMREREAKTTMQERSNWKTRSRTGFIKINTAPACNVFKGLITYGQEISEFAEARQISE